MYFGHVFNDPVWSECACQLFYIYHSLILSYYHRLILLYCLIYNPVVVSALFWVSTQFLQFLLSPRTFLSGFPQAAYYRPFFILFPFAVSSWFLQFLLGPETFLSGFPRAAYFHVFFILPVTSRFLQFLFGQENFVVGLSITNHIMNCHHNGQFFLFTIRSLTAVSLVKAVAA